MQNLYGCNLSPENNYNFTVLSMSFFQKLFGKKENSIQTYQDFWDWFLQHEQRFHKVVKQMDHQRIETDFFNLLSPKLAALREGYFFLAGMLDDETVDLVITAEGIVKNFVFVEELIAAAPSIKGWNFTALKPAIQGDGFSIQMEGIKFDASTLSFYPLEDRDFPDNILLQVSHKKLTPANQAVIEGGSMIFLDNFLGELKVATCIDKISFLSPKEVKGDPIAIEKLTEYLQWRQAEFVEKYVGERRDTENDNYSVMTAEFPNGNPLVAAINQDLLHWDRKASHPWMTVVEISYDGDANRGMPNQSVAELLVEIEDALMAKLHDYDGCLNIGRQTAENMRSIFFACRDFREPSKVISDLQKRYESRISLQYEIYLDKYWQTVERFVQR